jgi:hypothetical protein
LRRFVMALGEGVDSGAAGGISGIEGSVGRAGSVGSFEGACDPGGVPGSDGGSELSVGPIASSPAEFVLLVASGAADPSVVNRAWQPSTGFPVL